MAAWVRRVMLWGVLGLAGAGGLAFAFWPRPVPVDMVAAARGPLMVTVDEDGETRVKDVFVLSAPVSGRALRIEAEVGDVVAAGETVLARIQPLDPEFLDFRSEAQAVAAIRAAEAALALARAEVAEAEAELDFARGEYDRAQRLVVGRTITGRARDEAERALRTREAALDTARAGLEMRQFELDRARAQLVSPLQSAERREDCDCVPITAPVSGRILRVLHESEGVVAAGEALVEIGDPATLEIVADLLSVDAVRVAPGDRVIIDDWGGAEPLNGAVQRVEPYGFTKISALGIEEQRVNVIVDFTDPPQRWQRLGHGYGLEIRVVLWEAADVLKLPLTALFRQGDRWAAYVDEAGRAALRPVALGHISGFEAEVLSGIDAGEQVILHPSDRVGEGTRVRLR